MECVEAALKTSIRKEMALKTTSSQLLFDDFLSINVPNGVASCDDFFVDDLFDFSNEDSFVEEAAALQDNVTNEKQQHSTLQNNVGEECNKSTSSFAPQDEFGSLPISELCLPAVELDSLEWLSHFVEDSFASFPSAGALPVKPELRRDEAPPPPPLPPFKTPVPAKARSKRTRTGCRVWSLGSPAFTESSSSSSSSSSPHSPTSPLLIVSTSISPGIEPVEKPASKKQMRKPPVQPKPVHPRRCSHCGVHNTPQWRAGPLGAKTLCNACGVRYKSGRLLPEYRPACSPTFSSELHSNHHRKVLEMRKRKEMELVAEPEGAVVPPSFEK